MLRTLSMILAATLAACTPEAEWDLQERPADYQPPPGAQGLLLEGPPLAIPGQTGRWTVSGDVLQAGDRVFLAWGSVQAPGPCPFRRQLGGTLCMDIDNPPRPIGIVTAIDDPANPGEAVAHFDIASPNTGLPGVMLQGFAKAGSRSATTNVISVGIDRTPLCLGDDSTGDSDGDGVCDNRDLCAGDDTTGDPDGDGVCADNDPCPLDNPDDVDEDGVCASDELCVGDDASGDSDGDGQCDSTDRCPLDNPDDRDADWLCDSDDACPDDAANDADGDGVCGDVDLCWGNDATGDTDGDGTCDDLDPCPTDDDCDGDGLLDADDPCPTIADCDGDGTDDSADGCPLDALDDIDNDGICDSDDVCLGHDDAIDVDNDLIPDGCDLCTDTQWTCEGEMPEVEARTWYVAPHGDDANAGSVSAPMATLLAAVQAAEDGDAVYLMPGTHTLQPHGVTSFTSAGIVDLGKGLHIYGANQATVVQYAGADSSTRDGVVVHLSHGDSVLSNMVVQFAPSRNVNYSDAIFFNPAAGTEVHNVVFENISETIRWAYTYDNTNTAAPEIYNSIFRSNGLVVGDYTGDAQYTNCVFDILPTRGDRFEFVVRDTTLADRYPATLGEDLRHSGTFDIRNPGLARSHIGVAGGLYAWDTDCPPSPTEPDLDGDGQPDHCDACPADPAGDVDFDGVCDGDDVCPFDNPDDPDGDGVCSSEDRCPLLADCDNDGIGDEADICPGADDASDEDGDGIPTGCDPCVGDPLNECGTFPDEADYNHVWHVSTFGSDTFGDGTPNDPFGSVHHAVEQAATGDGIRIGPGYYHLEPMRVDAGRTAGIFDQQKQLAIWGANDQTVLEMFGADDPISRDAHAMVLQGDSTVSNLVMRFAPNRGTNYSNAVFGWPSSTATVRNVRFENTSTTRNWSIIYDNNNVGAPKVFNSAFISNGRQEGDYSGNPVYSDTLFEATPSRGSRVYTVSRTPTPADNWPASLPVDLLNAGRPAETNPDGTVMHIGVAGGLYAWNSNCTLADGVEDADGDGRADVCDPCPLDALGDADGDGVCGSDDICDGPDSLGDADGDRVCDPYDQCLGDDATGDDDGDGVCNSLDACPFDDPDDLDNDGLCDADDPCPGLPDCDFDGLYDGEDPCMTDEDCDGDGQLDGVDPCVLDAPDDPDGDGICTSDDNCPVGDDNLDDDADNIPDACDFCPNNTANDCGLTPDPGSFANLFYVAPFGDDNTATGGIAAPFGTLSAAVDAAASGDGIQLLPGMYNEPPRAIPGKAVGIWDAGKSLTIFGANDKTVLVVDASLTPAPRDVHVAVLEGAATVVSNLTVEFRPNRGANYSNAIFGWSHATSEVHNVLIRHGGGANWAYAYDNNNTGGPWVYNSVFVSEGRSVGDYSGAPHYINVLFDATPSRGTRNATMTRTVTDGDLWGGSIPADLRNTGAVGTTNPDGATAHIGTSGGLYPWTTGCLPDDNAPDSDGDGHPDSCDSCPDDPIGDVDNDGICEDVDLCLGDDSSGDGDADGLCLDLDICPDDADNDIDGDGICGDVDPCPLDAPDDPDGDGVCTIDDICPLGDDTVDSDSDGMPDACDVCPDDATDTCSLFPPPSSYNTLHYVATFGDDTTGDGTAGAPFASIDAAVTAAASGDGIRVLPGLYRHTPHALNSFTGAGIYDQTKDLVIFGANDQTVIQVFGADLTSPRDLHAVIMQGPNSMLANMIVEFSPNRGTNYSNALFAHWATDASIRNVVFENVSTTHNWAYMYDNTNSGGPKVHNSVFISNGRSQGDYSGSASYRSCLFDATPSRGSKITSLTRAITIYDLWEDTIPADLVEMGDPTDEPNPDGTTPHIGVGGGPYRWTTDCAPFVGMADQDGDGHPDSCDVCPTVPFGDFDGDGVCD